MFRIFACCLAVAGAATSTGAIVDATLVDGAAPVTTALIDRAPEIDRAPKGDRIAPSRPAETVGVVTTVELVGVEATTVILRDRDGRTLFKSDPVTNTTVMARDTALPIVTVKRNVTAPVATRPHAPDPVPSEAPDSRPARSVPVGCEGVVSSLVSPKLSRVPGRCLVERRTPAPRHEPRPVLAQAQIADS